MKLSRRWFLGAFGSMVAGAGCARQPPGSSALSGKRLIVTLLFRAAVNPLYHYYFVLNNAGSQSAAGPVAVLVPPYGNGFATGSGGLNSGSGGFTDFVVYDSQQATGYAVYHVIGDPNRGNFVLEGRPVAFTLPDFGNVNDPNAGQTLQFQLDLAQIAVDANGQPFPDPAETTAAVNAIRYLQANVIATNVVPRDPNTPVNKIVDSLGDTRTQLGASSFLVLDVSQNRVLRNSDFVGQGVFEPPDPDEFGGDDPSLDLIDWQIEVRQQ